MTKKKEKQPRGRPSKKQKEIFNADDGAGVTANSPPTRLIKPKTPAPEEKPSITVNEEILTLNKTEAKEEKTTCAACKSELDAVKKPAFCPNCGIMLNWSG